MPKELSTQDVVITKVRRIKGVKVSTEWNYATSSTVVSTTFSYEVVNLNPDGSQAFPPKPLPDITIPDADCRAAEGFPTVYGILSQLGHVLRDQIESPQE